MNNGPLGLGNRIKAMREARKLSCCGLGKCLGIHKQSATRMVKSWEQGKTHPSFWYLLELSKFFNVTLNDLCDVPYGEKP